MCNFIHIYAPYVYLLYIYIWGTHWKKWKKMSKRRHSLSVLCFDVLMHSNSCTLCVFVVHINLMIASETIRWCRWSLSVLYFDVWIFFTNVCTLYVFVVCTYLIYVLCIYILWWQWERYDIVGAACQFYSFTLNTSFMYLSRIQLCLCATYQHIYCWHIDIRFILTTFNTHKI